MDLRLFYQKMRECERQIATPHVVVVSEDTVDGGKAGVKTEVRREIAARLVVEGRARLATADETKEFHDALEAAMKEREREQLKSQLQVNVISEEELQSLPEI